MAKRKVQILRIENFPNNQFFEHLLKGTQFFHNQNYERAIEEWSAAIKLRYLEPINLEKIEGRRIFGSTLEILPFIYFLYAIHSNFLTGIGIVKGKDITKKLIFREGALVFASSSKKEERIGTFILKKNMVSPEQLETLAKEAKIRGKRLGGYLVEKNFISIKVLEEVLTLQIQEIVSDIFSWEKGQFYFAEGFINEEPIVHYAPLEIALIAARRCLSFNRFREQIPNNKVIFRLSPYVEEEREKIMQQLDANEQFIFSLIDGTRNIDQLIKFSGGDEVSVINILYRFLVRGWIRKTREVGEYEDKEFAELLKVLETLFDIFKVINQSLTNEMGIKAQEVIRRARKLLEPDHQKIFFDLSLEEPDKLNMRIIFKNIATHFPAPQQRLIFIDAFQELYLKILEEAEKFLGRRIIQEIVREIQKTKEDIEKFYIHTALKSRILGVLDTIVKKFF